MTLSIRDFRQADAGDFARLNRLWIEAYFGLEASDNRQLDDPQSAIIDQGGRIAIAESDGTVVGCGALVPPHYLPADGLSWIELVKFATAPEARGQGVGTAVLEWLINAARTGGHDGIWLETNERLQAATRLYQKAGFVSLAASQLWPTPYSRCNLQMILRLDR